MARTTRSTRKATSRVSTELREGVSLTRQLLLLPTTPNEAVEVVAHVLAQPGWTPDSIARVIRKRGWQRKAACQLVLRAVVRLLGPDGKALYPRNWNR